MANSPPKGLDWREKVTASSYVAISAPARWKAIPDLLFAVPWNAFFGVVYFANISHAITTGVYSPLLFLALSFVAFGIFMAHSALVGLFNSTKVTIDSNGFSVIRGPIHQRHNVREPFANVDSCFVEDQKHGDDTTHAVALRSRSGDWEVLSAFDYNSEEHATFVAQRLNDAIVRLRPRPFGYRDPA